MSSYQTMKNLLKEPLIMKKRKKLYRNMKRCLKMGSFITNLVLICIFWRKELTMLLKKEKKGAVHSVDLQVEKIIAAPTWHAQCVRLYGAIFAEKKNQIVIKVI
ncbi:unnamed protein product [Blepharisma stoltei]|uniref:Uncharacterized protein n=1 Tax=Blepharisma stoltei TaxID=1481888 RepID=A0AAU9JGH8_9CILI|nr:unnamed protein product [Blepharisma stoltei]